MPDKITHFGDRADRIAQGQASSCIGKCLRYLLRCFRDHGTGFQCRRGKHGVARGIAVTSLESLEDGPPYQPRRLQSRSRVRYVAGEAPKRQRIERVAGVETLTETPAGRYRAGLARQLVVKQQEAIEQIEGGCNRQSIVEIPVACSARPQQEARSNGIEDVFGRNSLFDDARCNRTARKCDSTQVPRDGSAMIAKRNGVMDHGHRYGGPSTALRMVAFRYSEME
jgi:hypothetical protein